MEKMNCADVINDINLEMGDYPCGPNLITQVFKLEKFSRLNEREKTEEEKGNILRVKRTQRAVVGFEGAIDKECRWLLETGIRLQMTGRKEMEFQSYNCKTTLILATI